MTEYPTMRCNGVSYSACVCALLALGWLGILGCNKPSNATSTQGQSCPLAGFDLLAGYNFEMTDELLQPRTNGVSRTTADLQIPAAVKALDQRRVALRGFMLPLKVENGSVTELLIMKDQSMCCYGSTPKIHEWVSVKMKDKGVKPIMDQIVTLCGIFHVGEQRENGYLVSIYRMDGESMALEDAK